MLNHVTLSNGDLDALAIKLDEQRGQRIMADVTNFLGRFVCYPSEDAHVAHALWCVHAHLMPRWDSTPRIAFLSPEPASGKSRALEVTELLVPNAVIAVNMSPSYLFRKIDEDADNPATILYDEIDTVFGPKAKDNEDIRGLLNAGHRRGAIVGRCVVRGKEVVTVESSAYAAVALAGLGWLPDTLMSRSIIVRMRRRHQGEHVEPFRRRLVEVEGHAIRDKIALWAKALPDELPWPELPAQITDRNADIWEALVTVADAIGGHWPDRAREAAVALVTDVTDGREPSLGIRLLSDLRMVFGNHDRLSSKAVIAGLLDMDESPWADLRGRPLDERGLSRRLAAYSIKSTTLRVGESTAKGYRREDFYDAWNRYLSRLASDESVTSVTTETNAVSV